MDKKKYYEIENQEWLDSLDYIIENEEPERVQEILHLLRVRAQKNGIEFMRPSNTPYINTIAANEESPFPGSREVERRIKSLVRWNAMAMVVRANLESEGIGGHISTYASAATLYEVGFNHFFRGGNKEHPADLVYFQGHASPGVYARSFLEGRLSEKDLHNFRQELREDGGLPSYPHPRAMPAYWQFPTVSMGLGPIMAIYQARFNKYLEDRGLIKENKQKVWALVGDGEMDEPESMGALTVASREELDNLIFVINCNLQRLDGPVRGNGKVIQELEAAYKGAGWNVIKVIWGDDWDPLLQKDKDGHLVRIMEETPDGQYQKYVASSGDYIRNDFFGKSKQTKKLVENYSDEQLEKLRRGGHDPQKVFNAYKKAMQSNGKPTVILAKTIKGYGLGEAGEGRNITHQQKKLNEKELLYFRDRFGIPLSDEDAMKAPFYKPPDDSEEIKYLKKRREEMGGYLPKRREIADPLEAPDDKVYKELLEGSGDRDFATTMAIVSLLGKLLGDKKVGKHIVPIVPDESRTFGMDALFRKVGIYSHTGQNYEPVDKDSLLYYKEATDGAILEEGITEAGCMSSFIAAGTSYSSHSVGMIPFFIFYSMFGFQRVGDLIWAAADARARGFLVGGTSGRTTLAGEGLQHTDGHSHLNAMAIPHLKAYDPAYAYEVAVIIKEGIRRMFVEQEDLMYYITVLNEKYKMPKMPGNVEDGILKGMYRYRKSRKRSGEKVHLMGSGAILNEALRAAEILEKDYGLIADVWSVTSYKELYDNARETERWNRMHSDKEAKKTYIEECFENDEARCIAAHDYVKAIPMTVCRWFPGILTVLGTDGFGRSDNRRAMRDHFEVDDRHIAFAALHSLYLDGKVQKKTINKAVKELKIDKNKENPTEI
ncbi:MAG: pyruvate dehydrogenase (acetyl-transferring), homodimeric type [Bacteroidales bacterium]|nr:pyruvate dehydrogenase (acetyl-transferring), homodimeric type [Bacteroidales bacterium]MCF8377119.1 pyruvate dehydrogenase (acetyl-transferring), homodimeric type [Bacteroidales bacterium]MCF8401025.1 pyruvate dehydrogenase (acetyl-transferring), homodimeric type [Bacteroidales bacterium]